MGDEAEIGLLMSAYAEAFDARDAGRFGALFEENAELVVPGGVRLVGRDRIAKAVRHAPPGGRHIPGEPNIQVSGDTAVADSAFRFLPASGPEVTGRYADRFVRTSGGWRFAFRASTTDDARA